MTTMASDHGSSSSSELDEELSPRPTDELDAILSSSDDTSQGDGGSDSAEDERPTPVTMTARAYQLEMLEESLKQNIIVVMDTGSGKTQVAILRTQAELERSGKILFDAVTHAFVPLSSLSLIVIDEAHNPVGKNSVARLMREHYSPAKAKGLPIPHILGLTASPLMTSDLSDLEVLEHTLHAVCRTPSKHRDELMAQVNCPEMETVSYAEKDVKTSPTMARLKEAYLGLDIKRDPLILYLMADKTPRSGERLGNALKTRKTDCRTQMETFYARARGMCQQIGPWAADYYIWRVISVFLKHNLAKEAHRTNDLKGQEWKYLADAFLKVDARPPTDIPDVSALSPKVLALLKILESHQGPLPVGIVFVRERATVAVLSHILSIHPKTRPRYRVGSMVGTSRMPGQRQDFLDLGQKDYLLSLQAFRKGSTNLLVATSVLEEGIDVPACNLVICFDEPDNLKSFIQRRGRARMSASQLYLLVQETPDSDQVSRNWQYLEQEMKRKYEDQMRENEWLNEVENSGTIPPDYPVLRDEETGAQITIDDAKAHLEHFCATLSTRKFVDWSPFYVVHDSAGNPVDAKQPLRKVTVHLPVSLAPELRTATSLYAWASEANACKDAAFQAYAKLYKAGLVNRHLLPIRDSDLLKEVEPRTGMATVRDQLNPWPMVAQEWSNGAPTSRRRVTVSCGSTKAELELVLPVSVPYMEKFNLHWDYKSSWVVNMDSDAEMSDRTSSGQVDHTSALLTMAFGHRWRIEEKQYPVRFVLDRDISLEDMSAAEISAELMEKMASTHLIRDIANQNHPYFFQEWLPAKPSADLVGNTYLGFDEAPEDVPYVSVRSWPKKAGFFRPFHPNAAPVPGSSTKPYPRVLPARQLRLDNVPAVYVHIGLLIPAITHALEVHLVAKDLLDSRLEQIGLTNSDLSLVVTAISASAARGPTDYERVEFLGDSILKFCTTVNCSANYLKYPEGCLSPLKDKIVANSRLFRAAVDFGLDRYIIHKAFTMHKWRPTYVEDLLDEQFSTAIGTRRLPTKTLADVVEALIGACYISGGIPRSLACISLFLPDFEWRSIERGRQVLYNEAPANEALPLTMLPLESLIGYTFTKKSLLVEAMTHPSCNSPGIRASLDRLEFLGDAILDFLVVNKLFAVADTPLENSTLHLLRTALVNADILGFLVMEWSTTQERVDVDVDVDVDPPSPPGRRPSSPTANIHFQKSHTALPLWSFLRHSSPDMAAIQRATSLRHAAMRAALLRELNHGSRYPWSLLSRLQAQKFYSDVFESVLGAVWVDSGSLEVCEAVMERAGILPLMRRLVKEEVHVLHPKEEIGLLAGRERVEYEVDTKVVGGEGEDSEREGEGTWNRSVIANGERVFGCRVLVGGVCVATADGAFSREEARTRAAEEGCKVLKERMGQGKKE
ncbi:hypothetical protein VTI74DRAFT_2404 [Chaetomium olivicolor]